MLNIPGICHESSRLTLVARSADITEKNRIRVASRFLQEVSTDGTENQ